MHNFSQIRMYNFRMDSKTNIQDSRFNIELDQSRAPYGIWLQGGDVGGNTEIAIGNNDFLLNSSNTDFGKAGIAVRGDFSSETKFISIYKNDFVLSQGRQNGIDIVQGEKNNVDIFSNTFEVISGFSSPIPTTNSPGIFVNLQGSSGFNNKVHDNNFLGNANTGIWSVMFQNTEYCSNFLTNVWTGIWFVGAAPGTSLKANSFTGGAGPLIVDGIIGRQEHYGNKWRKISAVLTPTEGYAVLRSGNPALSQFVVHIGPYPPTASSFSFHPDLITPSTDWFVEESGSPFIGKCTFTQSPTPQSSPLDGRIASGDIVNFESNQTYLWILNRNLYKNLYQVHFPLIGLCLQSTRLFNESIIPQSGRFPIVFVLKNSKRKFIPWKASVKVYYGLN